MSARRCSNTRTWSDTMGVQISGDRDACNVRPPIDAFTGGPDMNSVPQESTPDESGR